MLDNKHFRLFRPRGNIRDTWLQEGKNSPPPIQNRIYGPQNVNFISCHGALTVLCIIIFSTLQNAKPIPSSGPYQSRWGQDLAHPRNLPAATSGDGLVLNGRVRCQSRTLRWGRERAGSRCWRLGSRPISTYQLGVLGQSLNHPGRQFPRPRSPTEALRLGFVHSPGYVGNTGLTGAQSIPKGCGARASSQPSGEGSAPSIARGRGPHHPGPRA